ncbi:hypothetical protein NIES4073_71520 [Kalymmatonema gypsitolerans NIES-4073]|nr:hypothetical protein NIES4073_71520 [Scytonema sp. NIES-4073]
MRTVTTNNCEGISVISRYDRKNTSRSLTTAQINRLIAIMMQFLKFSIPPLRESAFILRKYALNIQLIFKYCYLDLLAFGCSTMLTPPLTPPRKRGGEKYSCSGGSFQRGALGMRFLSSLSKLRTAIKKLFRGLSISFIYK